MSRKLPIEKPSPADLADAEFVTSGDDYKAQCVWVRLKIKGNATRFDQTVEIHVPFDPNGKSSWWWIL